MGEKQIQLECDTWGILLTSNFSPSSGLPDFFPLNTFHKINFTCSYFPPLFQRCVCAVAAANQLCSVALPSTFVNFGHVWREKGTNEDLTVWKPGCTSPVEKLNKYIDPLDTRCIVFHTELRKPDCHLFTLKVCCRLSALQLLIMGCCVPQSV